MPPPTMYWENKNAQLLKPYTHSDPIYKRKFGQQNWMYLVKNSVYIR